MSIIAEALNVAKETQMLSLTQKMSEISSGVAFLRTKVKNFVEGKYLRLLKDDGRSNLVQRATEVSENIKELNTRLEQQTLTESSSVAEELRSMTESLIEARIMCELTQRLLAIDKLFEAAFHDQNSRLYYSAATNIQQIQATLAKDQKDLEFLSIYDSLVNKVALNYSLFSGEALKIWKTEVSWIACKLDSTRKTATLRVHMSKDLLENLIKTLHIFGVSEPQVYYFSESFYSEILLPCIQTKMKVSKKLKTEHVVLCVSSVLDEEPSVSDVLENLTYVFEFLSQHMNLTIEEGSRDFIGELGLHLADKLVAQLVRGRLSDAIPTDRRDLASYETQIVRIQEFSALLKRIKFLPEENDRLDKFGANVEQQFLHKKIEWNLKRAREVSNMNLQDMKPTGSELTDPKAEPRGFDGDKSRKESILQFTELPTDFGQFPPCHISKSVIELMNLVKEILNDCVSGTHAIPTAPLKLFCTARDCINLYVELSPVIHIKLLESLPQQSALFHNNCFYIAHELITLNEPYRSKYNDQVMRVIGTFVDMVAYVRAQGLKVLEFQVTKQNDTLLSIVAKSGLSHLAEEDLPPMLEKSLRQCIHQLTFLENMWYTVLPAHIYNKIMGQLCNSFLEEVILRVCLTKDIKEATATHLVRLFGYVQEALPSLFEEPKEIHRHVKKWPKFNELIHILNGSLSEIGDRWADGKGPLAAEFYAEQVRQLIKALFQVSERRAAILSRIK